MIERILEQKLQGTRAGAGGLIGGKGPTRDEEPPCSGAPDGTCGTHPLPIPDCIECYIVKGGTCSNNGECTIPPKDCEC